MAIDDQTTSVHRTLQTVDRDWLEMVARVDPVARHIRLAEIDIEVVLAGSDLARHLLPGFECHPPAVGTPVATVGAWAADATQLPIPDPIESVNPFVRQWIARRDGRPVAELDWTEDNAIRIGNRTTGRHLLGVTSAASLSPWEAGAPLRRGLWWALGPEALFVHAGAVATAQGAALIMGASGSGKSTTSLACLRAGMDFLSDDYCLVRGDPPIVHLLAATARVHPHELAHLDDLVTSFGHDLVPPSDNPAMKALFYVDRGAAAQLVHSAPVRAIVLPEVSNRDEPELVPIRPAEALRAAAPAALMQMHIEPDRELASLRALVSAVPSYRLHLSTRRERNPAAVGEAIRNGSPST